MCDSNLYNNNFVISLLKLAGRKYAPNYSDICTSLDPIKWCFNIVGRERRNLPINVNDFTFSMDFCRFFTLDFDASYIRYFLANPYHFLFFKVNFTNEDILQDTTLATQLLLHWNELSTDIKKLVISTMCFSRVF